MPKRSSVPASKRKSNPRLAVGYLRVSTSDQSLGLEAQRSAIEAFAAQQGLVIAAFHTDHGVSGATPVDERPGLLAALYGLAQGAGVLIAAKRDRLARDVVVAATIERLAAKWGARVLTADGLDSADTPEAVLMRTLIDAMAQYERALIRSRTKQAIAIKRARGEAVSKPPFGWAIGDRKKLVPVDHEQRSLELIRNGLEQGYSASAICDALTAQGHRPRGAKWHPTTITRYARRRDRDRVAA